MAANESKPDDSIKKIVGRKKSADVWDQLYQLNEFAKKLQLLQRFPADDGEIIKKVVGKPRASERKRER